MKSDDFDIQLSPFDIRVPVYPRETRKSTSDDSHAEDEVGDGEAEEETGCVDQGGDERGAHDGGIEAEALEYDW